LGVLEEKVKTIERRKRERPGINICTDSREVDKIALANFLLEEGGKKKDPCGGTLKIQKSLSSFQTQTKRYMENEGEWGGSNSRRGSQIYKLFRGGGEPSGDQRADPTGIMKRDVLSNGSLKKDRGREGWKRNLY